MSCILSACSTLPEAEAKKRTLRNMYTGHASWYGSGKKTANGEPFNPNDMTAAHRTAKFNTWFRLTNPKNNKTVDVRINDRGPFIRGREIDVTRRTAELLEFKHLGIAKLHIQEISR